MKKPDNFIAGLKKQEKYFAKLVSCKRKNGGGGGKKSITRRKRNSVNDK